MTKQGKRPPTETKYPNYQRVRVENLNKSRKGKHHELMDKIMEDLRKVEAGFAVQIPLDTVSVLNLRSAIVRAATKENIKIVTSSDGVFFYAWKADSAR
jgi:hypothetical protein